MPPSITAHTGLDVLSQAMEGFVSLQSTPLGDTLALEACRIVREWLPRAVADGTDLEARSRMLYAACLTGCVISQSGTTLVHGLGYYLTLEFGIAHGLANALLLPSAFRHNAACLPEKAAAIATALGRPCEEVPEKAGEHIAEAIYSLFDAVGLSSAAKDHGADAQRLAWCAEDIMDDASRFKNQPGDLSREQVEAFFRSAYEGQVTTV